MTTALSFLTAQRLAQAYGLPPSAIPFWVGGLLRAISAGLSEHTF